MLPTLQLRLAGCCHVPRYRKRWRHLSTARGYREGRDEERAILTWAITSGKLTFDIRHNPFHLLR